MDITDLKIADVINIIQNLDDRPQLGTTGALKEKFDHSPEQLRQVLNNLIDFLYSNYATKIDLQNTTLGQILDGSITAAKLSFDPATQMELDNHTTNNNLHVNSFGSAYQALITNATGDNKIWASSLQSLLTAQGMIPYASAANTPAVLAKGGAYKYLRIKADGSIPEYGEPILVSVASENVIMSANTERSTSSTTPYLLKSFRMKWPGVYRIQYDAKASNTNYGGSVRIQYGSNYTDYAIPALTGYNTYNQDFYVPYAGDTLKIYITTGNSATTYYISNVKVKGTYGELQDPAVTLD